MAVHVLYSQHWKNSIQRYVSELFAKAGRKAIILYMRDDEEKNGAFEEEDGAKNREFLRETVTNRGAGRQKAGKAFWLIIAAVVFGLIASLVFVLARPFFESHFYPETPETEESFELPTESESPEETVSRQTESETDPQETEPQPESEPETEAETEAETETEIDYLREASENARRRIANANLYVVQVTGDGTQGSGGFAGGQTAVSGLVWSATSRSGLILADYGRMDGCTSFVVTFWDGSQTAGTLKAADSETGIAVLSVDIAALDQAGISEGWPGIGYSRAMRTGDAAIVVGEPYGYIYSGGTAQVVYSRSEVPMLDGSVDVLYTDLDLEGSGFLLNLNGSLIGFCPDDMDIEGDGAFYGMSSMAAVIERLANGRQIAGLGIHGREYGLVQDENEEPVYGVYVQSVVQNSSAYKAGIQAGDVIVSLGDAIVYDADTLHQALLASEPGDTVTVVLYRQGREGYEEQTFEVTLLAR